MHLKYNIWKLYLIKSSKWMMLFIPIIWLFYQENGLTVADLFLIQSIYSITVALIEIPSGYVADVLGKKKSMILGTLFGVIGMCFYAFSYDFYGFLIAALNLGIGQSFISGSDTALVYDSLLALGQEKEFVKFEGRTISIGNLAEAIAGFIGAYFLTQNTFRTPFYYQIFIALAGFLIALTLVEPNVTKMKNGRTKVWSNIKNIIHFSLVKQKKLRYYILYSSVIGGTTLSMAWFAQPLLDTLKIEGKFNGFIFGILNLSVAFTAFFAHKIQMSITRKKLLILILIVLSTCYILVVPFAEYWYLILLLFYFMRGIATPVLRDFMNQEIPSEMRATVMSIRSFIIRAVFASLSPFFGYFSELYSIYTAMLFAGIIFLVMGSYILYCLIQTIQVGEE